MSGTKIPFTRPHLSGVEIDNILQLGSGMGLAGDGSFTARCHQWLEQQTGARRALLTHSCTAALEMCALLLDIQPGDEVIMPSFTFVSTANAFVLRGGVPVFVDVRPDTLNLDERLIEAAITERTRAIAVVHYAGIACEMDAIMEIAARHGLPVIEDAAQGLMARYRGKPLGTVGALGALSFHETKNIVSGEGGALLVNDPALSLRAEIIREKGTDRSRFFRGEVDKYTWQDVGSSYLPSDIIAAFLWGQLQSATEITEGRMACWARYHALLEPLEQEGLLQRPTIPDGCLHNAHIYYVLLSEAALRPAVLGALREAGIHATFHYVPLHDSPAGLRYGRVSGSMAATVERSAQLVRLPLWVGLPEADQERAVAIIRSVLAAG